MILLSPNFFQVYFCLQIDNLYPYIFFFCNPKPRVCHIYSFPYLLILIHCLSDQDLLLNIYEESWGFRIWVFFIFGIVNLMHVWQIGWPWYSQAFPSIICKLIFSHGESSDSNVSTNIIYTWDEEGCYSTFSSWQSWLFPIRESPGPPRTNLLRLLIPCQ